MATITAPDLRKEFPRSPFAELAGLPWLARMTDKTRALQAGTLGEYTPFPCGGDKTFLGAIGIDADAFKAQVDAGKSDAEIGDWVKANMTPPEGGLDAYRARMLAPAVPEHQEYLKGALAELGAARPELNLAGVDSFSRMICVEEGHTFPG